MKILFLTWKDIKHPYAWWAEKVIFEYAKWLVKKWHQVTWFWYSFKWSKKNEIIDWINIIRKFNLYTSYFLFKSYYKKNLSWKYDLIVDEAWWLPLLSVKFEKNIPIVFFAHHIWDKEWDYSYIFPLNVIWKKIYYFLYRQYKKVKTITVSESTKNELIEKFDFKKENIKVIENACDEIPLEKIDFSKKENSILFLGRLMPIKRAEHAILAFDYFIKQDKKFQNYKLDIVWNNQDKKYVLSLKKLVKELKIEKNINFLWHMERKNYKNYVVSKKVIIVPSMKEWFWLIVLEANSYWLPAIWYDVWGLRDSIKDGVNWYIVSDWDYLAIWEKLVKMFWNDEKYMSLSKKSLEYVKTLDNWDNKVDKFEWYLKSLVKS